MNKRTTGSKYEEIAASYLINKGYTIEARNYRDRFGEIDIVARYSGQLIFVEVKYRRNASAGDPLEAVNRNKQKQIRNAALSYMRFKGYNPELMNIRFDCIGILGDKVNHIENAF